MIRFFLFTALICLVMCLTTCNTAKASTENEFIFPDPSYAYYILANGDGYQLPSYGPEGSLFPQPVPGSLNEKSLNVPLPTKSGIMEFINLIISGVIVFFLRRQTSLMSPPG